MVRSHTNYAKFNVDNVDIDLDEIGSDEGHVGIILRFDGGVSGDEELSHCFHEGASHWEASLQAVDYI